MNQLVGLIPAAGKGVRARPYTNMIPKGMLEVNGRPNLERNICLMRDSLKITEIYIVVGYLGHIIKDYFKDGSQLGVTLHYIENTDLEKGLAWSILLAGQFISDYFCCILSDERYINSNHHDLLSFPYQRALATCAVMHVDDPKLISRNYTVLTKGRRIVKLIEKPEEIKNDMLGCGSFIFSPEIFPKLEQAFGRSENGYVEFITFLGELCKDYRVLFYELSGEYVNINDRDSLNLAWYHERCNKFATNRITLLIYSEGVEKNIAFALNRYSKNEWIHAIYVIVPYVNTIEKTVTEFGTKVIKCPEGVELYGDKIKYAMDHAPGDIFILCEADYTFPNRDIAKLIAYVKETDMVVGTRTTRQLIEQGSDMRGMVRMANIFLAKFLELLWWTREARFTDVGCTFRAIWKSTYVGIRDRLTSKGPEYSAEMMIEILDSRKRIIEIPVNYFNTSQAMNIKYRNYKSFLRFFFLILRKRFFR
jgi:dTDP-glucose pyrophosphorylase